MTIRAKKSDVAEVLAVSFPEYRGRRFRISVLEHVTVSDLHFGGGTRNEYVAVELGTGRRSPCQRGAAPWDRECPDGKRVGIPAGVVIVEHSIFCGEDLGITVHVNPTNAPRLLPAGTEVRLSRDVPSVQGDGRLRAAARQLATLRGCVPARRGDEDTWGSRRDELAVVDLNRGDGSEPFRTVVPFDALEAR